jgi:hypothetical protein
MSRTIRHILFALAALVAGFVLVGAAAAPAHSGLGNATFSGRATALQGTLPVVGPIPCVASLPSTGCRGVGDTGEIAATGGHLDTSLLCYGPTYSNDPTCLVAPPTLTDNVVNARALHATVVSHGKSSDAEAQVAQFALAVGGQTITGSLLTANASATCDNNGNVVLGASAQLVGLQVNGVDVPIVTDVNGQVVANQAPIVVGPVTFLVNQQSDFVQGSDKGRTVTALEIVGPLGTDIKIAQATADIACGTFLECPGAHQFVTGGGFIYDPAGAKENFAVAGRNTLGGAAPWGHVLWNPTSGSGLHVKNPYALTFFGKGTQLGDAMAAAAGKGFSLSDLTNAISANKLSKTTKIEGGAILAWDAFDQFGNDAGIAGEVLLLDLGEPGNQPKGYDYFEILGVGDHSIPAGAGFLQGGNIWGPGFGRGPSLSLPCRGARDHGRVKALRRARYGGIAHAPAPYLRVVKVNGFRGR